MARLVAVMVALTLAGCGSVRTHPSGEGRAFSGEATEAAVGTRMVNNTSTTVRVDPVTRQSRVEGVRVEFVYLGLRASDPAARNTIRVRYEEHKIVGGVEKESPDYWAELQLDLGLDRVIVFRGWRIGVVDATDSVIKYVAVSP
jgi:uncharacterized protein YceK